MIIITGLVRLGQGWYMVTFTYQATEEMPPPPPPQTLHIINHQIKNQYIQ